MKSLTNIPLIMSSGGSGGGNSVTFPATATTWENQSATVLIFADGTTKDITDYSVASGQTFENVVGIRAYQFVDGFQFLRMTIDKGKILLCDIYKPKNTVVTNSPDTTPLPEESSYNYWFGFLEDTVISEIFIWASY